MTSYSKTATTIWLYDVPRIIAEDLRIAFLQSNSFWQVSCAKSKTKVCTEFSAWAIDVIIEVLLSVKAATLIFISGRGSAIYLLTKGNQVLFIIWWRINKFFGPRKRACISWKSKPYTHLTLKAHNHKMCLFVFVVRLNSWSLIDKQCGPILDCSCRSGLIWVLNVCH